MIKLKKLVLKILIVCSIIFSGFIVTSISSASSYANTLSASTKKKPLAVGSSAAMTVLETEISALSSGTYYVIITNSFSDFIEVYIPAGVTLHVLAEDSSDTISAYTSILDDPDSFNIFNLYGGSSNKKGSGGTLYLEDGVKLYSDEAPCIIAAGDYSGSTLYIEDGASVTDDGADDDEGAIHDNGKQMDIYIYGTVSGGVKSIDENISYIYFGYESVYTTTLSSSYQVFRTVSYEVKYSDNSYGSVESGWATVHDASVGSAGYINVGVIKDKESASDSYSREYYDFAYWKEYKQDSLDDDGISYVGTLAASAKISITTPIFLAPSWSATSYSIEYELDGGTNSNDNPDSYSVTSSTISLSDPTKTGYTFEGWYESDDFSTSSEVTKIYTSAPEDITLYAKWTIIDYSITYKLNGGTNDSDNKESYTVEDEDFDLLDPTRAGYTFEGWYESDSTSGDQVTEIDVSNLTSLTLYAEWTIIDYSVTYKTNGGTNDSSNIESYTVNSSDFTLLDPTRTGYTFKGWYEEEDFTGSVITIIDVSNLENVKLYAKWVIDDYSISYELNGGTNDPNNLVTYTIEDSTIELLDPTRNGYTFLGWYSNEDFEGTKVTEIDTTDLENVILYAKWIINDYSISYELNGGTNDSENLETYTVEDSTFELLEPTRTGYTFQGWYTSSDFSGDAITEIDTSDCQDIKLYAKWTINSYTITFDSNGGTSVDPIVADYLEDISELSKTASKTGYTFVGWYTDSELTDEYTFDIMDASDITLYAKWTVNSYTLTFITNDGTSVKSITADYGTDLTSYDLTTTKTGYSFVGWYTDSELTDEYTISTMDAEDIILYAKWSTNSYTITFDSNGGSSVDSITAEYCSEISAPTDPTLDGYAFAGWYTDSDLTESYTFDTMESSDITLYAKWVVVYTNDEETISGSVSDLSSVLSSSELTDLNSIKIVVSTDSTEIDSDDQSLISDFISSMDNSSNIGEYYLNITVYGVSEDNSVYKVTELQSQTTITIALDYDYTGYSSYGIIRCHDGETEELDSTYDSNTNTISFSSNEFSTYAIYYINSTSTDTESVVTYNVYYLSFAIIAIFLLFMFFIFKFLSRQEAYAEGNDEIIINEDDSNDSKSKEPNYKKEIKTLEKQIEKGFKKLYKNISLDTNKSISKTILNNMSSDIVSKTDNSLEKNNVTFKNIDEIKSKKDVNDQIKLLKQEISRNLRMISENMKSNDKNIELKESKKAHKKAKFVKAEVVKENKKIDKLNKKKANNKNKNNSKNLKNDQNIITKPLKNSKEDLNDQIGSIKNEINENLKMIRENILKANNIKIKQSNKQRKMKKKLAKSNKKLKKYSKKNK